MALVRLFSSYEAFLKREDKSINGTLFKENVANESSNTGCWECLYCENCKNCENCIGSINCVDCKHLLWSLNCLQCENCENCNYCRGCSDCVGLRHKEDLQDNYLGEKIASRYVPIIKGIHNKVLKAIADGGLDMGNWHCGTTHCRAGWVVTLAGEAGEKLEFMTSTSFAARLIYRKSSPYFEVGIADFRRSNAQALADITWCAIKEKERSH